MFRLIAIALTSTFLLLALFGTSSEQAPASHSIRAMGVMGSWGPEPDGAAAEDPRRQYVSRHHQPLKAAPDASAGILRILPYGAVVEVIEAGEGSFARVRDPVVDEIGFIRVDSLSDRFPG